MSDESGTMAADFDGIGDADGLHRQVRRVVERLLRREQDRVQCGQTVAAIDRVFATPGTTVPELRRFCREVAALTAAMRPGRDGVAGEAAAGPAPAEADDGECGGPVPLPVPTRHGCFAELLAAALVYRIRRLTTFFQRRDPGLRRQALPPFLLSPDFDRRFETVIVEDIAPAMMKVPRFVGAFEHARPWNRVSTEEFWTIVAEGPGLEERLLATWRGVWSDLKPRRNDDTGKLVVSQALARIRRTLDPGEPPAYAMPKVGSDMINLFGRLLSDLRDELDVHWSALVQTYQQEVERRWYQHRARPGAMTDAVTDLFAALPGRLGEFVAILCHYNLEGIDEVFLREVAAASAGTVFLAGFLADGTRAEPAPIAMA